MPKLYFQVASQDGWGRHRTEGYAYLNVPSEPGKNSFLFFNSTNFFRKQKGFYHENLNCWRPRGDSIFNELRRFFIGGSHELEDINYVGIPKQFESEKVTKNFDRNRKSKRFFPFFFVKEKTPLSRFGFRTVSTGTLDIRMNVIFQSQWVESSINVEQTHRFSFAERSPWNIDDVVALTKRIDSGKKPRFFSLRFRFESSKFLDSTRLCRISTRSSVRFVFLLVVIWFVSFSLFLDAFQQAKKRALDVQESTFRLINTDQSTTFV